MAADGKDALANSAQDFLARSYDYIIVGGGTAGLVLAARLTENPDVTVGVLEAGPSKLGDVFVDTPAMFLQMFGKKEYEWMFMTTPQEANGNKKHHMVRGRMLGGSSGINYMMYVRPSDQDYDDWASLVGDQRWSAANMKQYMQKHQTLEPVPDSITDASTMPFDAAHHGTDGPVRTSFNDTLLPVEDLVITAAETLTGFARKPLDPWSGDHLGFFRTLGSVARTGPNKGKRSYAARGYFEPNRARPNLTVLCDATVTKVVLEGATAVGVAFAHGGATHEARVKREVLVCAGAVQSPQILELSGIGDPAILKAVGVEPRVALPDVGAHFQDHTTTLLAYTLKPGHVSLDALKEPANLAAAVGVLGEKGEGPLTCISSCQGFFPYKKIVSAEELRKTVESVRATKAESDYERRQLELVARQLESDTSANLQLVVIPTSGDFVAGVADQSVLYSKPMAPGTNTFSLVVLMSYPASRGTVHITSADVNDPPAIDPAYNKHPADVEVIAATVRWMDALAHTAPLGDAVADRYHPPTAAFADLADAEQSRGAARSWVLGTYHPIGTCAMGAVTDATLKVKGVKGLRVVDASVFPNHVSGNICSSVYAVAEHAADIIKAENGH